MKTKKSRRQLLIQKKSSVKRGFTLIEALISVFIFSLAMTMFSGVFSNFLRNFAAAKKAQKNIETAQYAINTMAKTIRTSTVIDTSSSSNNFTLQVFDHSRTSDNCIEYKYDIGNKKIQVATTNDGTPSSPVACTWTNMQPFVDLTDGNIDSASISISKTDTSKDPDIIYGQATIMLMIKDPTQTGPGFPIETSVSLRQ